MINQPADQEYEPCALEEATHARTANKDVYKLFVSGQDFYISLLHGYHVYSHTFPTLGITPVRKKEFKPVEFVVKAETVRDYMGRDVTVIKVPREYDGKTFKCAEVQP